MLYLGIDQHKRFSQVAVMDESGRVVQQRRLEHGDREWMREFFRAYRGSRAVLEATRNWDWLWEMLEEERLEPVLSHPYKTRLIAEARIKTDKVDAKTLAQLLRTGFLPVSHVLPREQRDDREVHRLRIRLVRMQTRLKNQVHVILDRQGIGHPHADLFGKAGREFLASLRLGHPYDMEIEVLLGLLDEVGKRVKQVTGAIRKGLRQDDRAELLLSVPGIGEILGYLILHEVGDMGRFSSAKRFASYCALVPVTRQSADKTWQGRTSRQGNLYLKWAFVEAAHTARKKDPGLAHLYDRLCRKRGPQKAIVAVAHKLAISVYHVLTDKEMYRSSYARRQGSGKPGACLGRR